MILELQNGWMPFLMKGPPFIVGLCLLSTLYVKKSTFNIGCLYITHWSGNRYISTLHYFEHMHFSKVHYEVKFHFLFPIFPSAPFLKDRFLNVKGRRSFFGWEGHLILWN